MARLNENTGRFSGLIGPVVMVEGRTGPYLRSKCATNTSKTEAQLRQRDKMRKASQFLKPLAEVLKLLYVEPQGKSNYQQAALSQAMRQAIDEDGNLVRERVLVSRGTLAQPHDMRMEVGEEELLLAWTDNSHTAGANADDRLVVVLYNPSLPDARCFVTETTRRQGTCRIALEKMKKGDYLVYATFLAANGKQVSNSCLVDNFVAEILINGRP